MAVFVGQGYLSGLNIKTWIYGPLKSLMSGLVDLVDLLRVFHSWIVFVISSFV